MTNKEKPLNEKVMKFEVVKPTLFWYKAKDVAQAVDRLKDDFKGMNGEVLLELSLKKRFGDLTQ